ncbi:MAG: hypothetical protein M3R69_09520 [Acidobacteriota bacterium]|nr:hypothetical protein [Acidobacteriota bacterium]
MRRIDCENIRRELEAAAPSDLLSSTANEHLKTCKECGTFRDEEWKLRKLVASLGTVNAPGDFEFRLRARLASEKRGTSQSFAVGKFSFGFGSAAFATVLLMVAAVLLFVGLRTPSDNSEVARKTAPTSIGPEAPNLGNGGVKNVGVDLPVGPQTNQPVEAKLSSNESSGQHRSRNRVGFRPEELSSARGAVRSRDLASTPATVLRSTNPGAGPLSNAFPIGASYQSLKVSLDDGRGSSRTISLPSISFGSQRALTQGATPVLATARGSW